MSGIISDNQGRSSGLVKSAGGGGTILSAKSFQLESTTSTSGGLPTQLSAFDMSFAPTESDSKLWFQCWLSTSGSGTDGYLAFYFYDVTNSAIIGALGDAASNRPRVSWATHRDGHNKMELTGFGTWHEPGSTDSRDYTIFGACGDGAGSATLYINRTSYDTDVTYLECPRCASTFTITEYAASAVTLT